MGNHHLNQSSLLPVEAHTTQAVDDATVGIKAQEGAGLDTIRDANTVPELCDEGIKSTCVSYCSVRPALEYFGAAMSCSVTSFSQPLPCSRYTYENAI
jgi:hypothetical protein